MTKPRKPQFFSVPRIPFEGPKTANPLAFRHYDPSEIIDGKSLKEVTELGRRVNAAGRSMGMALTPCVTPASGEPSFELDENGRSSRIGVISRSAIADAGPMCSR